jgi:hypothetical protein
MEEITSSGQNVKEEKVSITKDKESYCSKEVKAIKLFEAPNGLRRNSSLPDLFEGEQNLKFRRKFIHRDSDKISSMDNQIRNENTPNKSNLAKVVPEKKKRLSEVKIIIFYIHYNSFGFRYFCPPTGFSTNLRTNLI